MKKIAAVAVAIAILAAAYLIGMGFRKSTDVFLAEYSVTEDGAAIRLEIQSASSMGYVRGFQDNGGGVKPHYLTFYRTFGGINSALGMKNAFILQVEPEDTEIYFNRPDGGYELILQKDAETGEWVRPAQ